MDTRMAVIFAKTIRPLMDMYQPYPHLAGNQDAQKRALNMLGQTAMKTVPKTWDHERLSVFGDRLWEEIQDRKATEHSGRMHGIWPTVEQVGKAAEAIVADMQKFDRIAGQAEDSKPVRRDFPSFYARMAETMALPIEDSRYMQDRKAEWIRTFGQWPLDKPAEPIMGDEPGFQAFYHRMRAQILSQPNYVNPRALLAMLDKGRRHHEARFGPWQQAAE